jgi:uncharacterized membrane protein
VFEGRLYLQKNIKQIKVPYYIMVSQHKCYIFANILNLLQCLMVFIVILVGYIITTAHGYRDNRRNNVSNRNI